MDIQVPKKLTSKQRKLLEEFAESLDPEFGKAPADDWDESLGVDGEEDSDNQEGAREAREKGIFNRIKDVLS